ncbi:hypothetical protein EHEL_060510 [Encephalitozoon hellem ATCC 50504]|uniref:Uncharacterized protein n=1 Tax=Encephalitozoon hellem TaxID=27973 RepID=A0A9Q9C6B3_ENCHE|nr:uncharacterized protein EHEL_060510 [Encephalitozoon hellem ATCC 50504]AFM98424.1 hypothetical protein EHEL_060510 [Encephalitozoon hellem ATCC 50504]UTX43347.1 hypothetical protein GPU96_06g10940 [Encephalitozoon hellem]WEL38809.1 hypothetical protein PFJ87_06g00750 [Encephalitozoon hellem]|eukprot:XP_003887405.1 hypothetical protein EHEL_060510 [Encephalitozoon hellem ATCC 50504]
MDSSMKKRFIELLSIYGSDFDAIASTSELDGMTSEMLYSRYPEILDTYFLKNTPLNQDEINWLQIKEIYYMNERFYFDVLVGELCGSHVIKNGRDLEVGKELVLLLKDYEFKLLSKLSILDRLYKNLYRDGMLSEDLSRKISISSSKAMKRRSETGASPDVEGSTPKKKPTSIAVVVKNSQEMSSTKDEAEDEADAKDVDHTEEQHEEVESAAEQHLPDPRPPSKDKTVRVDYSAILRLSREQKK